MRHIYFQIICQKQTVRIVCQAGGITRFVFLLDGSWEAQGILGIG